MLTRLLKSLGLILLSAGPAHALSCAGVSDVTALTPAGCTAGPLILSDFQVFASAGFTAATLGIPTVLDTTGGTAVRFQLATTPSPGPGDVLLAYRVDVPGPGQLTAVDLTNNGITPPVTIGELVCRAAIVPGGTCAGPDRLATLVAGVGEQVVATLATPADPAFIFKDIAVGAGGFTSDFTNSHAITPVPEPATWLLLGL